MSNLSINEENGVLLVDSRLLAQELGIQPRSFYQKVILKYQAEIEEDWGVLRFEISKPLASAGFLILYLMVDGRYVKLSKTCQNQNF